MTDALQGSSFDVLLAESRDLMACGLAAALRGVLDNAGAARHGLPEQRARLEEAFRKFCMREFERRSRGAADRRATFAELQTSLHLVGEEDLEETLRFKDLATRLRRRCEEELGALDQRVGVLIGDAQPAAENNPFGAQAICDALQQALRELECGAPARSAFLKLFDDAAAEPIRAVYESVNALLVSNGILPKIRYGVARKDEPPPGPHAAQPSAERDFFPVLQQLLAAHAPGTAGAMEAPLAGQPALQGTDLLAALTRLQQDARAAADAAGAPAANLLRELKAAPLASGMLQTDAVTLDIVAMLFDQLFDDPEIPLGLKGLIGRLQIPMLKVAIADKAFFSDRRHPARELLDALGELAPRLPVDFTASHPLFARLEGVMQQVLADFEADVAVFGGARDAVRGLLAEEEREVAAEAKSRAEGIEQAERLAAAKAAAEDEVRSRVQARSLPGPVLEFLVEQWRKVLLLRYATSRPASDDWKGALQTMDELIWSVGPMKTIDDRRRLAALVPSLVKRLAEGLRAVGVDEPMGESIFADLMRYHTKALGALPGRALAGVSPSEAQPGAKAVAAPPTVKNPFGEGEVRVGAPDAVDPPPDLAAGCWVEFHPGSESEKRRAAKLLFVSPRKTHYLFSDRRGRGIVDLTRAEIVRRLRNGEAVRLREEPEEPLYDRVMSRVIGKLRAPVAPAR